MGVGRWIGNALVWEPAANDRPGHQLRAIRTTDHVIGLSRAGGEVVVTGTPEEIAACKRSHTGRFLKTHLAGFCLPRGLCCTNPEFPFSTVANQSTLMVSGIPR